MAMTNIAEERWERALTPKEASKITIHKGRVRVRFRNNARMVVEEHQRRGTPRDGWEPTALHDGSLAEPFHHRR